MLVSVADAGVVAGESQWVCVSIRGDKNDVKRYSSEIRDLCKPLARTEADFMECVFAEFIATVADQALAGVQKKAKKDKAKKTPGTPAKEPKTKTKSKASTPAPAAPAAPAAAPPSRAATDSAMDALKKQVRGMLSQLTRAGKKMSPEDLAAAGAKVAALSDDLTSVIDSGVKAFKEAKAARKKRKKKVPRFSPFLLFCKDARPKLAEKAKKNPAKALSVPDQAREMGRQWNNLSDAKKAPYINEASKLKAEEMERRANAPSDDEDEDAGADGKKRKRKHKKKTPRFSAFLLFCKDVRPKIQARNEKAKPGEKQAVPQQAKEMGSMWQNLEQSKKDAYYAKAEKLKREYHASPEGIAAAAANAEEDARDDDDDDAGASRARKKQKRAKRPRFSGFLLFCKEVRPKLPESLKGKVTEQAREMGRMWKELSEAKREKLEAQAAKQKAAFLANEAAEEAARRADSVAAAAAPPPAAPPPAPAAPAAAAPAPPSTGKRKRRTKAEMEAARAADLEAALAKAADVAAARAKAAAATAQTVAAMSPVAKTPEKAKRHRRTKAEMEAARAAGLEPPAKKSAAKAAKAAKPASDSSESDSDSDDTPLNEL